MAKATTTTRAAYETKTGTKKAEALSTNSIKTIALKEDLIPRAQIASDTLADIPIPISDLGTSYRGTYASSRSCRTISLFEDEEKMDQQHQEDSMDSSHERYNAQTSEQNKSLRDNYDQNKFSLGIGTDTILVPLSVSLSSNANSSLYIIRDQYFDATEASVKAVVDAIEKQLDGSISLLNNRGQKKIMTPVDDSNKEVEGKKIVDSERIGHESKLKATTPSSAEPLHTGFRKIYIKLGIPSIQQFMGKPGQSDMSHLPSVLMKVDIPFLLDEVNQLFWEKITSSCPPFYRKLFSQQQILPPADVVVEMGGLLISRDVRRNTNRELEKRGDSSEYNNGIDHSLNSFAVVASVVLEEDVGTKHNHSNVNDSDHMLKVHERTATIKNNVPLEQELTLGSETLRQPEEDPLPRLEDDTSEAKKAYSLPVISNEETLKINSVINGIKKQNEKDKKYDGCQALPASTSFPTRYDDQANMTSTMMNLLNEKKSEKGFLNDSHISAKSFGQINTSIPNVKKDPSIRHGFTIVSPDYLTSSAVAESTDHAITEVKPSVENNRKRKANMLDGRDIDASQSYSTDNHGTAAKVSVNKTSFPTSGCSMDLLASISSEIHAQQEQQEQDTLLVWNTLRQLQQNQDSHKDRNHHDSSASGYLQQTMVPSGQHKVVMGNSVHSGNLDKNNAIASNKQAIGPNQSGASLLVTPDGPTLEGNYFAKIRKSSGTVGDKISTSHPDGDMDLSNNKGTHKKVPSGITNKNHKRLFVQHSYKDYSNEEPSTESVNIFSNTNTDELINHDKGGLPAPLAFPSKLHETLTRIEQDGYDHIIGWLPHGRSFKIFKQKEFTEIILSKYFVMTKKSSFLRQLNLYGFHRISTGGSYTATNTPRKNTVQDQNSYYHERFLRGIPHLCLQMKRQKVNGNKIRSAGNPDQEPDFSIYPICPPKQENRLVKPSSEKDTYMLKDNSVVEARTNHETNLYRNDESMPREMPLSTWEKQSRGLALSSNVSLELQNVSHGSRNDNNFEGHIVSHATKPQSPNHMAASQNSEVYERTLASVLINQLYQAPGVQNHQSLVTTTEVNKPSQSNLRSSIHTGQITSPVSSSDITSSQDLMTSHRLLLLASQLLKTNANDGSPSNRHSPPVQGDASQRTLDSLHDDTGIKNEHSDPAAVPLQYSTMKRKQAGSDGMPVTNISTLQASPPVTQSTSTGNLVAEATKSHRTTDDSVLIDNSNAGASNFPWKLQRILDKLELEGKTDVISWLDHGRAFIVKNSHRFLTELMPLYFSQTKYSSFQRQLHMYNFERITSAKSLDKGAYHHPNFLRGFPERALLMQRTRVNGKGTRQPGNPAKEPNFFLLPPIPKLAAGTVIEDIPTFSGVSSKYYATNTYDDYIEDDER